MSIEPGRVAVVIPLQDECATVTAVLRSLALQTLQPDAVIVVDAGSTDSTVEFVSTFSAPFRLSLLRAGRVYPGEARNAGVAISNQEWLAFTDGGVYAEPTWLAQLMAQATDEVDVVFGSYAPICDSLWTEASAIAYVAEPRPGRGRGPFVASMAIRRRAFGRTGGFPAFRAAEDLVLLERIASLGLRCTHAPEAVVHWQLAATPVATYRRFALYSHHNLAAGRGRFWHRGLARLYVALLTGMGSLAIVGGLGVALASVPVFFVARALNAAWRKHGSLPFETVNLRRVLAASGVLAVVDLGSLAGVIRWLRHPVPPRGDGRA